MEIKIARGDQKPITFKIKNKKGIYFSDKDIDELVITCKLEPKKDSPILFQKKLSDGSIVYDVAIEKFVALVRKEDTESLEYGEYGFDIEITKDILISTKTGKFIVTDKYTEGGIQ